MIISLLRQKAIDKNQKYDKNHRTLEFHKFYVTMMRIF